jgi:insertion element IS1 protein InsB
MKKKEPALEPVNDALLAIVNPAQIEVEIWREDELAKRRGLSSELDEMWSYVKRKSNPRWLWHAIDHHTGKVLAYVFGRRKDDVFLKLKVLLEPFGITRYYTDGWGAYERHVEPEKHTVGKENTQKIESKHTNLRTRIKRLVRRTICFSKTERMHDLVIGLFINRYPGLFMKSKYAHGIHSITSYNRTTNNYITNKGVSPHERTWPQSIHDSRFQFDVNRDDNTPSTGIARGQSRLA